MSINVVEWRDGLMSRSGGFHPYAQNGVDLAGVDFRADPHTQLLPGNKDAHRENDGAAGFSNYCNPFKI